MCHEICYSLILSPGHSVRQEEFFFSILQKKNIVITYCQLKILLKVIQEDLNEKTNMPYVLGSLRERGELVLR